jgi:hypothetical protein
MQSECIPAKHGRPAMVNAADGTSTKSVKAENDKRYMFFLFTATEECMVFQGRCECECMAGGAV